MGSLISTDGKRILSAFVNFTNGDSEELDLLDGGKFNLKLGGIKQVLVYHTNGKDPKRVGGERIPLEVTLTISTTNRNENIFTKMAGVNINAENYQLESIVINYVNSAKTNTGISGLEPDGHYLITTPSSNAPEGGFDNTSTSGFELILSGVLRDSNN